MRALWPAIAIVVISLASHAHSEPRQFTFSWPFADGDAMRPRGGTTRGAPLTLATEPSDAWRAVHEPGLTKFERDRRAILAMAGGYRTTFDFLETVGFTPGFTPSRPYQSWATEYINVVEDAGTFIRLQHVIVMFVADRDGKVQGPFVQKHWRQDWRYEDTDLHVFIGGNRWARQTKTADEVRGLWSQAVFQVDDSPRYESLGEWEHYGTYSAWTSGRTARPLPRREATVRSDYQILEGTNRHTLTPTGWVQEEDNLKLVLGEQGQPAADTPYLAREVGVARYEHVVGFDFSAGDEYWQRTGPFWRDVRAAWDAVYAERDSFEYLEEVDGQEMFVPLFEHAERLAGGEPYDAAAAAAIIRSTFAKHLR
ncbi:MAG TPA: DUF6607 family protein [Gammaproteobacteria bacterium]